MHVYIDESGGFICTPDARVSAIGALAIPSTTRDALFDDFSRLRRQFSGTDAELKGSRLSERQIAGVISLLLEHDALLEACIIDTGAERDDQIGIAKREQADALLEHVTSEHQPSAVAQLSGMRDEMLRLPNQVFVQMALTVKVLRRALETFINYHAQRTPQELSSFHWRVDAKAATLTPAERLWRDLVLPMMHEDSFRAFRWADYSFMDRYAVQVPPKAEGEPSRDGWNLRGILREDLAFRDSETEVGLQLADIATNALTRALNGRLQHQGWRGLGRLLVRRSEQTIELWTMNDAAHREYRPPFGPVLLQIEASARSMLLVPVGYTED